MFVHAIFLNIHNFTLQKASIIEVQNMFFTSLSVIGQFFENKFCIILFTSISYLMSYCTVFCIIFIIYEYIAKFFLWCHIFYLFKSKLSFLRIIKKLSLLTRRLPLTSRWRPSYFHWRPQDSCWRPSHFHWRPPYFHWRPPDSC